MKKNCFYFTFLFFPFSLEAQQTIFLFQFENTETVTIDNAVGIPVFSIIDTLTTASYFTGVSSNCTTIGGFSRSHAGWNTGEAYQFETSTEGFENIEFNACLRTSNTTIGNFLIRASTDGMNWTTVQSSFTLTTTFASFGGILPVSFDNQSSVIIQIYKTNDAGSAGNNIRVDNAELFGTVLLPIELTGFKVEKKQNKAQLTWSTAMETNNDYFVIEHAADGNHFSAIGKVAGAGTALSAQQYFFTHDLPEAGANYYRLKQVDFDGAFEYSRVVVANFESRATFRVHGNPVATQLNVELQEPAFGAVAEIISAQGALLAVKNIEEEILSQQFDVSDLPAGHYFIRLKSAKFSEIIPFQKL